ncbi:MAG: hypothetical protein ACRD1W_11895 [Vicinamibacterales bacterium]
MAARIPLALVLFVAASTGASAQSAHDQVRTDGRVCRINRSVDRLIVMTDSGDRLRIVAESTRFTFGRERFEPADLRPGDPVRVAGRLKKHDVVEADTVRVRPDVADAVWEALFPSRSQSLVGRFAVREAQTEFFSLNLPGMNYVRIDAKGAYGGNGRVRASSLKSGDLLEVRGEWVKDDLFRASYIDIQTDNEPAGCKVKLSASDAAAEQAFLGS